MMNSVKSRGAASIGGGGQEDGGATVSLGISSAEQLLHTPCHAAPVVQGMPSYCPPAQRDTVMPRTQPITIFGTDEQAQSSLNSYFATSSLYRGQWTEGRAQRCREQP